MTEARQKSGSSEEILNLQRAFDAAELQGDADTLRRLLAEDFRAIGPKGFVLDRAAWIGRHAQFKYLALEVSEVDVRMYAGAAIVRNVQRNRSLYEGRELELAVRVSQVWVTVEGEWRLAAVQFSPLPEAPANSVAS